MIRLNILSSGEIAHDTSKLERAWLDPRTFVFLPEHADASSDWFDEVARALPEPLRFGHFILFTSGSTGEPKLVIGDRKKAEALCGVIHKLQRNEPAKETIIMLPLAYCFAFVNQWLWSRVFERDFVQTPGFARPDMVKSALLNAKDAMLCLVGSQVPLFIRYFGEGVAFPGVVRLHFAGGLFPQNNLTYLRGLFPNARIFNNYGCAEAIPRLTIRPEEDSGESANIGKPLPGVAMRADGQGNIFFKSPYSAVGFYSGSDFSAVENNWIATGDIGEQLGDGSWRIKGRSSEVFKRFGEKISFPSLLKTVYSQWRGAAEFYIENDDGQENRHVLVISPKPNEKECRAILGAIRRNFSRAHWPVRLEIMDSFPMLENGKVDRMSLTKSREKIVYWHQGI